MNKKDFLDALNRRLAALPAQEREKSLLYFFYSSLKNADAILIFLPNCFSSNTPTF